jgi:hypothetical protein
MVVVVVALVARALVMVQLIRMLVEMLRLSVRVAVEVAVTGLLAPTVRVELEKME